MFGIPAELEMQPTAAKTICHITLSAAFPMILYMTKLMERPNEHLIQGVKA